MLGRFDTASIIAMILLVSLSLTPLIPHAGSVVTGGFRTGGTESIVRTVTFASDVDWEVFDADPSLGPASFLGDAQFVCLNSYYPSPCPSGATLYGWGDGGWTADLSSIPKANWIWAPNITGQTTPAEFNQFFFSRSVHLSGTPISGSISIAVDDFAEVRVNGHVVGSSGSITDFSTAALAQHSLKTFDLTPFLVVGINRIVIRAENGPFGLCCPSSYSGNPAGVVYGGSVSFQSS